MEINRLNTIFSAVAAVASLIGVGWTICHSVIRKRKADLSIVVLSCGGGEENIAIKNFGEAEASNISISFPHHPKIRYNEEVLTNALISKGQQLNISFHPTPHESNIQCVLEWDDKAGHHNKTQSIQILLF